MTKSSGFSTVEKLTGDHDIAGFSCGREALDEWLKKHALNNQGGGGANTYVVRKVERVVGYYTLVASTISVERSTARAGKGQPRMGAVPAALLARLAVDETAQGQGLGAALLKDALLRCERAADIIGVRVVLVHALDEKARDFYRSFDFEESPADGMTLMLLMKDVRKILSAG